MLHLRPLGHVTSAAQNTGVPACGANPEHGVLPLADLLSARYLHARIVTVNATNIQTQTRPDAVTAAPLRPRDGADFAQVLPSDGQDLLSGAVCFALYSATQATVQYYRDVLSPFGITYQQLLVLSQLWQHDDLTPGQIASALCLDSSTVSGLLNRLERQDLVVRQHDAHDRRTVHVRATAHSRQISQCLGFLPDCLAQAMKLSAEDAHALLTSLHALRDTIASAPRPAPSSGSAPTEGPLS